jgi:hypothetical protein
MGALTCAFVAQSVERFLGKEEVAGPIPAEGLEAQLKIDNKKIFDSFHGGGVVLPPNAAANCWIRL